MELSHLSGKNKDAAKVGHPDAPSVHSATTGLVREPRPSMVIVTVSPGLSQRLGVRPRPTPGGVPVETMSPGSKGVMEDRYSISSGILKTSSRVLEFWSCSPSMVRLMPRLCGSGISSAVTMAGPMGQKVGKLLDMDHCVEANCTSRALTSLTMV